MAIAARGRGIYCRPAFRQFAPGGFAWTMPCPAPAPVRLHDHLPLPLPGPHDGARPAHRDHEGPGPAPGRRERGTTRRGSGSASSASTSRSAWSPASRWSSSSAPTGRASPATPGNVIGQTLAMEGVFAFFLESTLPVRCSSSGSEAARRGGRTSLAAVALFVGQLALRLLHHRDQRLHAAPGGPRGRRGRDPASWPTSGRFSATRGRCAQYAHNMIAVGRDGVVRRGGRGRVLPPAGPAPSSRRASSCALGADRRARSPACSSPFRPATARRSSWRAHQPVALAAMEGRFESGPRAGSP